jgi:hypothetical protein
LYRRAVATPENAGDSVNKSAPIPIFDKEGMRQMTPHAKRNIANILILLSLGPALLWILLMAMALSGALLPWIAAGVFLSGIYLVFLSICITSAALMWSSTLKASRPDIWTTIHRIPAVAAKLILFFGVLLNLGLWGWERFRFREPSTQVTLPGEENQRLQEQMDKKIRELESLRR